MQEVTLQYSFFEHRIFLQIERMKKILFWLCCLCCLCLVGSLAYLILRPVPPAPQQGYYADFLPDDTIATISLYDMKGVSETFPQTSFGHFLSKPIVHEMMGEFEATYEDINGYNFFYDSVVQVMTNPIVQQVFGDDVVIALCPPDLKRLEKNTEQELKNSLLAFGTSSSAGWISKVARIVLWNNVTNTKISGLDMTRLMLDEQEVLYGYNDQGVVLLAYNPQRIVAALERKTTKQNLQQTTSFLAAQAFWEKDWQEENQGTVYARSYCNMPLLHNLVTFFAQKKAQGVAQDIPRRKTGDEVSSTISTISTALVGKQGELRVRIKENFDPKVKVLPLPHDQLQDIKDMSSALLRKNTLLHYRIADFDRMFFRRFLSPDGAERQYQELERTMQKNTGISLNNILKAVGPRAGVSVHGLVNVGMFPLPKTVFAFQVQDKKAANWVVRKLGNALQKQGMEEQQQEVQGHHFSYWSMMPLEATHLAIALTDSMLYIANDESQLKTVLTEKQATDSLRENMVQELGKTVGSCVTDASVSAFFIRPKRLAEQVAPVAGWLTDMLLASTTSSGKKTQEEIFALMRSVDSIAACRHQTKTGVSGEIIIKILRQKRDHNEKAE
ncbi:MAG: DUF3352 domain-containing protein [Candidatus Electrothrix sp. AX2]|nr:DUF3352 domain-containing protein [Candidatus Electrothrix gigas]